MLPFPQLPWAALNLSIRAAGDPHVFGSRSTASVATLDRDQPLTNLQTLESYWNPAARTALHHVAAGYFFGYGSDSRDGRNLWRHCLFGFAAHARN